MKIALVLRNLFFKKNNTQTQKPNWAKKINSTMKLNWKPISSNLKAAGGADTNTNNFPLSF